MKVLSVDHSLADKVACDMEHALSSEIFRPLTEFVNFVERCPHCLEEFRREQTNPREP